jgi:hypothetical protein
MLQISQTIFLKVSAGRFKYLRNENHNTEIKKVSSRDLTKRLVGMYTQYLKPVFFLETLKGK